MDSGGPFSRIMGISRKMMGGWPACVNPSTLQQNQNPGILPDSNGSISQWPPLPPELPPPPPPPPPPLPQGTGDFNFRAPTTLGPYSTGTFRTSRLAFANQSMLHRGSNLTTINTTNMNPRGDAMKTTSSPLMMTASSSKRPEFPHSFPSQGIRKHPQNNITDETYFKDISYNFGRYYKELMNLLDNNMGAYQNAVQVGKIIHKLGHTFGKSWKIKKMHKDSEFLSILYWTMVNWDNVKIKALLWVIVHLQNSINGPLSFIKEDAKELTDIIKQMNILKMDWKIESMEFLSLKCHLLQKRTADFLTKEIDGIINSLMKGRDVTINPTSIVSLSMERFILEPSDHLGKSFVYKHFNSHSIPSKTPSMLDAFSKHVATLEHLTTKKKMAREGVSALNEMREIFTKSRQSSDHDQNKFLEILFQNLAKLNNYGIKAVLWHLACIVEQISKPEATKMQQSSVFVKGYGHLFQNFDIAQSYYKTDIVELLTIKNRFAMQSKMVAHNLQRIDQLVEKIVKGYGVINVCNFTILGMENVSEFYPSSDKELDIYETFIRQQFQKLLLPVSPPTAEDMEDFLPIIIAEVPKRTVLDEIWLSDDDENGTNQGAESCKSSDAIADESKDETVKTRSISMTKSYCESMSKEVSANTSTSTHKLELPPKENKFLRRFARIRHGLNLLNKQNMDNTGLEVIKRMIKWFTKNQKANKGLDNAKFFTVLFQEIPELNNYGIKAVMWAFCGMVGAISFSEAVEFRKKGHFKVQELLDKFEISKCNWKSDVIEFLAIRRRLVKEKKINDECLSKINNLANEMTNTRAEIDLDAYIQSFKSSTVITYDHFYPNKRKKNEIQVYNSTIEEHIGKLVVQEFPETVTIEEEEGSILMEENAKPIRVESEISMSTLHVLEPDSASHSLDKESSMKSFEGNVVNPTAGNQDCLEIVSSTETVVKPSIEKWKCQILQILKITPKNLQALMNNVPTSFEDDVAQNGDPKDMTKTNTTAPINEKRTEYLMERIVQEKLAFLCVIGLAKLKSGSLELPTEGCKRKSFSFRSIPNMPSKQRKGDKIVETTTNLGIKVDKKTYESRTYSDYLSQFTFTNVEISTIEITLPMDFTGEDYVNHISALSYISHRLQMMDNVYSVIFLHCSELYTNNLETNTLQPES